MHLRVWKFRPPAGREDKFANAYSGSGLWADLFAKAKGFRGTTLLRPTEQSQWWMTIDRWDSASDFETFQRNLGDDYHALDAELEGLAGEEQFVGAFEDSD